MIWAAASGLLSAGLHLAAVAASFALLVGLAYLCCRALLVIPRRRAIPVRGVTVVALLIVGLRVSVLLGVLASSGGASLQAVAAGSALGGAVGLLIFVRDLARRRFRCRRPNAGLATWAAGAFIAITAVAACFSPPTAWDLYTHWLLVPHEMVRDGAMLSLNVETNSVAPEYALHQPLLCATLMLLGVPDGRLALLSVAFVGATWVCIVTDASLLRAGARVRDLVLLVALALTTCSSLVFGFAYGDAILILSLALCAHGLLGLTRRKGARHVAWTALCVTAPIVGKGVGHLIALGVLATMMAVWAVAQLRRRDPRLHGGTILKVVLASAVLLAVERYAVYRWFVLPAPNNGTITAASAVAELRGVSVTAYVSALPAMLFRWQHVLYGAFAFLAAYALFSARGMARLQLALAVAPGAAVLGLLLASLVLRPELVAGLPRYSFQLVPFVCLALAASLRAANPWARRVVVPALALLSVGVCARGEWPGYVASYFPYTLSRAIYLRATDPEYPGYAGDLRRIAEISPRVTERAARYVLLGRQPDPFLSYRAMLHLVVAGYRGHLYSDAGTSRTDDRGERAAAARAALLSGDAGALARALTGIDVVVCNAQDLCTSEGQRRVYTRKEFLDAFAQSSTPPAG